MSLNFQFTNSELYKAMTAEDKELNEAFIWGCMLIGLREITEKNAVEWQWRYAFAVKLNGAFISVKAKDSDKYIPYIPTLEEVKKRIGLHTNSSEFTHNQFVTKQSKQFKS